MRKLLIAGAAVVLLAAVAITVLFFATEPVAPGADPGPIATESEPRPATSPAPGPAAAPSLAEAPPPASPPARTSSAPGYAVPLPTYPAAPPQAPGRHSPRAYLVQTGR